MLVPFGETAGVNGVLGIVMPQGAVAFGRQSETMLRQFAGQAAVAMELARARRDAKRVVLYEDRDRIAQDLHDLVIQRLFAGGMQLESSLRLIRDQDAVGRRSSRRRRPQCDDTRDPLSHLRAAGAFCRGSSVTADPIIDGDGRSGGNARLHTLALVRRSGRHSDSGSNLRVDGGRLGRGAVQHRAPFAGPTRHDRRECRRPGGDTARHR